MQTSGPLVLLYLALYVWTAAASTLGLYCGLKLPLSTLAPTVWSVAALLIGAAYWFRLPLSDLFHDLSPRERLGVSLLYLAAFFSPFAMLSRPPWILSFVALNALLAAMCQAPVNWHRLLLNNNLIVFGALIAYQHKLTREAAWAILAFVGAMWVVTAILDHFASVLERAGQGASGMGAMLAGLIARQTLLGAALGAPLVAATLWLGPPPRIAPAPVADFRPIAGDRPAPRMREADFWQLLEYTVYLAALAGAGIVLLKYIKRHSQSVAPPGLGQDLDASVIGQSVAAPVMAARRTAPRDDALREQVIAAFEEFCDGMRVLDRGRIAYQTAREYCQTLTGLAPAPRLIERATRTFETARYGHAPLTNREAAQFGEDLKALKLARAREYATERARETLSHASDNSLE